MRWRQSIAIQVRQITILPAGADTSEDGIADPSNVTYWEDSANRDRENRHTDPGAPRADQDRPATTGGLAGNSHLFHRA